MTGTREQHAHAIQVQVRNGTYEITRAKLLEAAKRLVAELDRPRPVEVRWGMKETT